MKEYNGLKWLIVAVLLIGGMMANYYYADVVWAIRAAIGIVLLAVSMLVAAQTAQGKLAWEFTKNSRMELRKVVWPTRQEAGQITLMVVVIVTIASLIIWGVDSLFIWLIGLITGQGG